MHGDAIVTGSNEEQELSFTVGDRDMLRDCVSLLKDMKNDPRVATLEAEMKDIKLRMARWAGGLSVLFIIAECGPWIFSHFKP